MGIGSEVYLIGYPADQEESPKPAIARGMVTLLRSWPVIEMTCFRTDIPVEAGQSGGVLEVISGEVLGIVGHIVTDDDLALVSSVVDILPRVTALVSPDARGPGWSLGVYRSVGAASSTTLEEFEKPVMSSDGFLPFNQVWIE